MNEITEKLAAQLVLDDAEAQALGTMLAAKFKQYETDRRLAELKWARNARQFLGIYDPDVDAKMDPNKSKAYPKLTRVKCVSMLSRLMNLLFPADDKNWTVQPSPVPELSEEDLQGVLTALDAEVRAQDPAATPSNEQIETAILKLAEKRGARLELEISDQLQELGGSRSFDYVSLARKVLASGIQYGMGVLKGPFVSTVKQRTWERNATGQLVPKTQTVERPRFEFVSIWDYYPDMTAKAFEQMDGQFQRMVMSKHQLTRLKKREDFLDKQIDKVLAKIPEGNYTRRPYETELNAMGVHYNTNEKQTNKYEALVWEGFMSGASLRKAGVVLTDAQADTEVRAVAWIVDGIPIKLALDPWTMLMDDDAPQMYHHFIFEEDESSLTGNGLPNIMRDSQMSVCAGARMILDNGSITCGVMLEVNQELLITGQDVSTIHPNKVYVRDDDNIQTMGMPAVRSIDLPSHINELKTIVDMFSSFADQETFVSAATGGDMQKGPSEPFRTAAGASMLKGDAALPFKDVVRNFDMFTQSVIGSVIAFNKQFNKNPELQGDFRPIARGATSLIAKEVLGIQLDNLANTLTEEEKMFVDMHGLAKARVRSRDMDVKTLVVDDTEAKKRMAAKAEADANAAATQQKMTEAQIREILSQTLKNLSQAGKNSASAEATTANVILAALEKGVSADALANTTGGGAAASPDTNQQIGPNGESVPAATGIEAEQVLQPPNDGSGGFAAPVAGGSPSAGFAPVPMH
jgi:hypothetical protein